MEFLRLVQVIWEPILYDVSLGDEFKYRLLLKGDCYGIFQQNKPDESYNYLGVHILPMIIDTDRLNVAEGGRIFYPNYKISAENILRWAKAEMEADVWDFEESLEIVENKITEVRPLPFVEVLKAKEIYYKEEKGGEA